MAELPGRRIAAQPPENLGLQQVGVLEFVDQHVAVSGGKRHAHLFGARQQVARVVQQVVEVEECGCALRLLEGGDNLGDLPTDQRQETASGSPLDQGMRITAGGIEVACSRVQPVRLGLATPRLGDGAPFPELAVRRRSLWPCGIPPARRGA